MSKYKFILLCGPTGSGKGSVPEKLAKLKPDEFVKIEKDEYVTESSFYKTIISQIIEVLGIKVILDIINGSDNIKKKELTDLFNSIYFNASNTLVPCDTKVNGLNCAQLHDKKLGEQIIENNIHIVLEINGDKDYSWIFYNTEEPSVNPYFNKTHSNKLLTDYDVEIYYLSGDFNKLLDDNKERFIKRLDTCKKNKCEARLGNFLMEEVYKKTILNICIVINELKDTLFNKKNVNVFYYKRIDRTYINLQNMNSYFYSFDISDLSYLRELRTAILKGGKKKKKRKTKKRKIKRRKYKKRKTKKR